MKTLPQTINELSCTLDAFYRERIALWSGAVNFLILEDKVVFIKRAETMPSHKGEIAFMGGHKQQEECPMENAIREFCEESSMESKVIKYLGLLAPVVTSGQKMIIPVLGQIEMSQKDFFTTVQTNGEWTELITVPIKYLLDKKNWISASWHATAIHGPIFFCPIAKNTYSSYRLASDVEHMLWGATARMVWNSLNIIEKLIKEV